MSQYYPDINSPQFGQQARSAIVGLVLAHLPVGIDGRKIDDRLAWDILLLRLGQTHLDRERLYGVGWRSIGQHYARASGCGA